MTSARCIACLTPTSQPWHKLCRSCWAWSLFGQHIRRAVGLSRLMREARQ